MAFTLGNIQNMATELKRGAGALLADTEVIIKGGNSVTVKLHVGMRRAGSTDLTGGMIAENQYATIDADDWDNKVGRDPYKGDTINWAGRRYAIEDSQVIAPAGNKIFYKCRVRG